MQELMDKGVVINRPPRDGNMAFVKSPDNVSIELIQKATLCQFKSLGRQWKIMVIGKI